MSQEEPKDCQFGAHRSCLQNLPRYLGGHMVPSRPPLISKLGPEVMNENESCNALTNQIPLPIKCSEWDFLWLSLAKMTTLLQIRFLDSNSLQKTMRPFNM